MTAARYSTSAIALHWIIALALAFQLALGFTLEAIPRGAGQFSAYQFHKSLGILILGLTLVRVAIRLLHRRPPPLVDAGWAQALSKTVHIGLYGFMIGAPLTGWLLVSTSKIKVPTLLFGVVPLPHLPVSQSFGGVAEEAHEILAFLGIALFVLHVAGAFRHQFRGHEPVIHRMIPWTGQVTISAIGALAMMAAMAIAGIAPRFVAEPAAKVPPPPAKTAASTPELPLATAEPTKPLDDAISAEAEEDAVVDSGPIAWAIDPGGSLGFTARLTDAAVQGRFARWTAQVSLNPDALETANIRVEVDLSSVDSDDGQRDDMLKGSDFFETSIHPRAVFTSRTVKRTGADRYVANGVLTLRGQSHPVRLSFSLKIDGDQARIAGTSRLERTRFGVGSGEWADTNQIADVVDLDFRFTARKQ